MIDASSRARVTTTRFAGRRHPMPSRRTTRRLLRHHVPLAAASAAGVLLVLLLLRDDEHVVQRWSMATAYVGLVLLAATLTPGAWAGLRGRRYPTSTDLRRDVGVWAGLLSVAHFALGWNVHMRHRWQYFLAERAGEPRLLPRLDAFGLANWAGLAATLVAVLLLALSNDRSLRRLGRRRWKRLQTWNVALFVLVVAHGALYQWIERRSIGWVAAAALLVAATGALRLAARRARAAAADERVGGMPDGALTPGGP